MAELGKSKNVRIHSRMDVWSKKSSKVKPTTAPKKVEKHSFWGTVASGVKIIGRGVKKHVTAENLQKLGDISNRAGAQSRRTLGVGSSRRTRKKTKRKVKRR